MIDSSKMQPHKIKVLVVDDSHVSRMLLVHVLNADPAIQVIGTVNDGQSAVEFLATGAVRPDVVLMDIHMPTLDGFEATRRIMETQPLPIVICTATADPQELAIAFRSMEAGAVACVKKPGAFGADQPHVRHLVQTVRLMSEVKVVRRWSRNRGEASTSQSGSYPKLRTENICLVGIGASTGGPPVLQTILSGLPKRFPSPLLIVQHIARGFLPGMVEWLNQTTGLHIQVAAHGIQPLPGHAYIAPDDFHLGIGPDGHISLARRPPENGLRPAVSWLFRSLADHCGSSAIGVLLTGMGKDGAAELKLMKDRGAITIAQDRESSVVHGMPGEAIALGGATHILPADRIATILLAEMTRRNGAGDSETS
jgi:two-component system, chemotaxis family, protein-glutamate methylesterase/glutaminase